MKIKYSMPLLLILAGCTNTINAETTSIERKPDPYLFQPVVIDDRSIPYSSPIPSIVIPAPRKAIRNKPLAIKSPIIRKLAPVIANTSAKKYALSQIGAKQFSCLDAIWTRESHWNYRAYNRYSGAYGIPQAVPGSKMAWAGADWRTNPTTQVKWGLHYIKNRYGSACNAWSFWQSHHWY